MSATILNGDCRTLLATLDAGSVQTCVTSPPYFGLRDYGVTGQIGLEATPEAFVAELVSVFREVRRVLRDDGTLWLNLGDSYVAQGGGGESRMIELGRPSANAVHGSRGKGQLSGKTQPRDCALPAKNLLGIPWRVAFALQQPYYAGNVTDERARIWLAAMLDAEGCLFIHKRKAGQNAGDGYTRQSDTFSPGLEISNTHEALVARCAEIAGVGSISTQDEGRRQRIYRWTVRADECRTLVRELYPHIIGKQHQARLAFGCPTNGERADAAHAGLKALHAGSTTDVDFPAPASLFEPGYYLRSDVIWSKPNPMPESVTDRPTKAHEYLFLLTKSERYYYDYEAIKEDAVKGAAGSEFHTGKTGDHQLGRASTKPRESVKRGGFDGKTNAMPGREAFRAVVETRNKRTVWTVPTSPYSGAHFATFPPALIEPCILAGSKRGDTVLDPFGGAGTTGLVADRLGRNAVLCELNPVYAEMARRRIADDAPLFVNGAA